MKKIIATSILSLIVINAFAHDVKAVAHQSAGKAGDPIYITSKHAVRLYNGADHTCTYGYHYMLCVNGRKCTQKDFMVTMAPHTGIPAGSGKWSDMQSLQLRHVFAYPGHYQVMAKTWTDGEGATSTTDYSDVAIDW